MPSGPWRFDWGSIRGELQPGGATLSIASATAVHTLPVEVEPGVSILQPDTSGPSLGAVPGRHHGTTHDLTSLPLPQATGELVLVTLEQGRVTLHDRTAGHRTTLDWNIDVFPQCLLWLSNGGRSAYPWNGRFRALGTEPVAAPFDLGQRHGEHAHSPPASMARTTAVSHGPAVPFRTATGSRWNRHRNGSTRLRKRVRPAALDQLLDLLDLLPSHLLPRFALTDSGIRIATDCRQHAPGGDAHRVRTRRA